MDVIRATYYVNDEVVARDEHVILNVTPDNIRVTEENVTLNAAVKYTLKVALTVPLKVTLQVALKVVLGVSLKLALNWHCSSSRKLAIVLLFVVLAQQLLLF